MSHSATSRGKRGFLWAFVLGLFLVLLLYHSVCDTLLLFSHGGRGPSASTMNFATFGIPVAISLVAIFIAMRFRIAHMAKDRRNRLQWLLTLVVASIIVQIAALFVFSVGFVLTLGPYFI